jgi:hypothetical protein
MTDSSALRAAWWPILCFCSCLVKIAFPVLSSVPAAGAARQVQVANNQRRIIAGWRDPGIEA